MRASLAHRILLAVLPALVIASIAASTIWGGNGLVARAHLVQELDAEKARLATVDRENARLLREIDLMQQDPVVLERVVAEELSQGRPGTVIYRFDQPCEPGTSPCTQVQR